jgi:hypothetical protein
LVIIYPIKYFLHKVEEYLKKAKNNQNPVLFEERARFYRKDRLFALVLGFNAAGAGFNALALVFGPLQIR